jgi:hypothetical protein
LRKEFKSELFMFQIWCVLIENGRGHTGDQVEGGRAVLQEAVGQSEEGNFHLSIPSYDSNQLNQ